MGMPRAMPEFSAFSKRSTIPAGESPSFAPSGTTPEGGIRGTPRGRRGLGQLQERRRPQPAPGPAAYAEEIAGRRRRGTSSNSACNNYNGSPMSSTWRAGWMSLLPLATPARSFVLPGPGALRRSYMFARSSWMAQWTHGLSKSSRQRASSLLAGLLCLVLLGVSPRSVSTHRPDAPRCHDSRRPRPPRHNLTACISTTLRVAPGSRQSAIPPPQGSRFGDDCANSGPCITTLIPPRISSELTKPDYLKLFSAAHQQSSPPG
jgi:hypothetical protein